MPNTDQELNRLVAEKMMKWTINIFLEEAPGVPLYNGKLWQPCTDPAASRMVIERMIDTGSSLIMNWTEDNELWEVSWITGGDRYSAYNKSLDRAICEASVETIDGDS